jgi:alkylated DNA repair dioxygenase AlkB
MPSLSTFTSISYHADDETFLGPLPTIASLTLGSSRDFYLRRKFGEDSEPSRQQHYTKGVGPAASRPTEKMALADGDLVVMRGRTQAEWEHSIPKRANAGGRINLTFRKVVSVKGTNSECER